MGDLSASDVQRAVNDGLHEVKDMVRQMRDDIRRIEQRTNDLDYSQTEIRDMREEMKRVMPALERLARWAEHDVHETQEITQLHRNTEDIRLRVQTIEQQVVQLSSYVQTVVRRLEDPKGLQNS